MSTMQLSWKGPVADDRYVADRAWERAVLCACPLHPEGGCGLQRLGTYGRVSPAGVRVPRWWCPVAHKSISLLPTFLAARLTGTLDEVEAVVSAVEQAGGVTAALERVHPADAEDAIDLQGALRSMRRRMGAVHAALLAIITLMPERFAGTRPTIEGLRTTLATDRVLVALRELAARHLPALPAPLGFAARVDM
ncbi:MAG TPA: hypothetical protein VFX59_06900 [Polyangiales bacterium]|nr:hypothetical protein [Polyangiales bacterium]